jgi:hypothetical protein
MYLSAAPLRTILTWGAYSGISQERSPAYRPKVSRQLCEPQIFGVLMYTVVYIKVTLKGITHTLGRRVAKFGHSLLMTQREAATVQSSLDLMSAS